MKVFQTLLAFSGNAPPQLALTRELVGRGHQVRVLAHRAARERIEDTGAEFVAFKQSLPDLDITRRETDSIRDWEARTALGGAKRMRDAVIAPVPGGTREIIGLLTTGTPMCWCSIGSSSAPRLLPSTQAYRRSH